MILMENKSTLKKGHNYLIEKGLRMKIVNINYKVIPKRQKKTKDDWFQLFLKQGVFWQDPFELSLP